MPKTATRLLSLSMVLVAPPNLVFPIQTRVLDLVTTAQIQTPNILATPNESSNSAPSFLGMAAVIGREERAFPAVGRQSQLPQQSHRITHDNASIPVSAAGIEQ